jgi:hypothetical protein
LREISPDSSLAFSGLEQRGQCQQCGARYRPILALANFPTCGCHAHYYNGKSSQSQFFDVSEEQIGMGLWYDF